MKTVCYLSRKSYQPRSAAYLPLLSSLYRRYQLLHVSFLSVCSLRLFTFLINSQKEFLLCFKCVCICLGVSVYCVRVACVFRVRVLCVGVCRRVGVFGSVLLLDFNFSLVNYRHPLVVRRHRPGYRTSTASGCLAAAA